MTEGSTTPDHRGRTGLHLTGLDLDRNPDVVVTGVELLAHDWHVLRATTLERRGSDGTWRTERRETYDRGNGATILLHDTSRRTVLLTRQVRYPVYVNGHPDGMMLEAPAGSMRTMPRPRSGARRSRRLGSRSATSSTSSTST